jgi:5-methylcytosine-specific restriction protein A
MRIRARLMSANPLCVLCQREGRVAAATELDHRVPLWQGGTDDEANLDPLCAACHRDKTAREAGERG